MNPYINVYQNATHGAADGDIVSMDGENTSPISVLLDSAKEESKVIKLNIIYPPLYGEDFLLPRATRLYAICTLCKSVRLVFYIVINLTDFYCIIRGDVYWIS